MTDERRRHERYEELLEVKVTWPGQGEREGMTRNFSDGGTFVEVSFAELPAPADGDATALYDEAQALLARTAELTARTGVVLARGN